MKLPPEATDAMMNAWLHGEQSCDHGGHHRRRIAAGYRAMIESMRHATECEWYLAKTIFPVPGETVLVFDAGRHYLAHCLGDEWRDNEQRCLALTRDARWTDLPRP